MMYLFLNFPIPHCHDNYLCIANRYIKAPKCPYFFRSFWWEVQLAFCLVLIISAVFCRFSGDHLSKARVMLGVAAV